MDKLNMGVNGVNSAVWLMAFAAFLGASAQVLFKRANPQLGPSMLTNWPLVAGLCLYGIAFIINIVAYRYGDASLLYPVIALSYVFIMLLAWWFLGESMNAFKIIGACTIVVGVMLIAIKG